MAIVIISFFMITFLGVAAIVMLERERDRELRARIGRNQPVRFVD